MKRASERAGKRVENPKVHSKPKEDENLHGCKQKREEPGEGKGSKLKSNETLTSLRWLDGCGMSNEHVITK
jgi:hypothetical protein